jgi:cytochrome P450
MTSHQAGQLDSLLGTPEYRAFCRVELDDPYPLLDELRSAAPVHWSPLLEAWVITSYPGVVAALGHPQLSSDRSAINARGIPDTLRPGYGSLIAHIANWLGFIDPPKHSRLRRLAHSMINPALAATYRPWISVYVRETMNEMRRNEHVNLLDDLALRMPLALICTVLGVPDPQAQQFHRWTCDVGPFAGRVDPSWTSEARQAADRANASWLALEDMFRRLMKEKQHRPADDMITRLADAAGEGTISADELIGLAVFFLAAGHGTTRNLLASGLYLLLTHPAEAAKCPPTRTAPGPQSRRCCATRARFRWCPGSRSRTSRWATRGSGRAIRSSSTLRRQTGTRQCSSARGRSTSRARTTGSSPSGGAGTSVSAPRSPA